jgi:hypothetical protein
VNATGIEQQMTGVAEDLTRDFAGTHTPEQVEAVINRWRQDIEPAAKIQDFIPVLVRRFAREELTAGLKPARQAV